MENKRTTEYFQTPEQNNAILSDYAKAKIDKAQ